MLKRIGTRVAALTLATLLVASNYTKSLAGLFAFMALLSTAAALVLYFSCATATLRLQRQGVVPSGALVTTVAGLGIIYSLWALYGAGLEALAWGAALLAAGIVIYLVMRVLNGSSRAEAETPAVPQE